MLYADELYHYGRSKLDGAPVGSGRYPLGSGKEPQINRQNKKEVHPDYARAHDNKMKVSEMSDAELRKRINRLQMERQYAHDLNPNTVNKGKEYVKYITTGLTTVGSLVTAVAGIANNYDAVVKLIDRFKG